MSAGRNPLQAACIEAMADRDFLARHPDGVTALEVLAQIRSKDPGAFPLCTMLDVHDELSDYFGAPR